MTISVTQSMSTHETIQPANKQGLHTCTLFPINQLRRSINGFIAVVCLVVTPNKVKPPSKEEKIATINLRLHPTNGDPVGQDSPWKTACEIMQLVLGFPVSLRGDLTGGLYPHHSSAGELTGTPSFNQLKWTTTTSSNILAIITFSAKYHYHSEFEHTFYTQGFVRIHNFIHNFSGRWHNKYIASINCYYYYSTKLLLLWSQN